MPRVVPSQVVSFIDSVFPPDSAETRMYSLDPANLSAALDLVEEIPDELLTMDQEAYGSLIRNKARIRHILATWIANLNAGHKPLPYAFDRSQNPLTQIRVALAKCPDESPSPGTSELTFVTEADLRTELQIDIGRINRALANGEWKAATVLAGSAVEALLLWALNQRTPAEIASAIAELGMNKKLDPSLLESREWDLHGYIQVAEKLGVIKPDTATAARLAKDFRNLIHPGRALRLAQKCDRGTALSAVAGMELVVRDLTP